MVYFFQSVQKLSERSGVRNALRLILMYNFKLMTVEEKESFCSLHFSVYEVNIQFTEEKKFILLI